MMLWVSLPNPDIKELEFTPIKGNRIKEIDQLIYRGRQTWEQAWPDREKNYQLGYFRLAEAFFDVNNDGKKDHIIRKLLPAQSCKPLNKDEFGKDHQSWRKRVEQWESMTKQQQIKQAQMYGFLSAYIVLQQGKSIGYLRGSSRILSYQGKAYPTYSEGMSLKNKPDLNDRNWFSIAEFSGHISSKNTYGATPVCTYKLNEKDLKNEFI